LLNFGELFSTHKVIVDPDLCISKIKILNLADGSAMPYKHRLREWVNPADVQEIEMSIGIYSQESHPPSHKPAPERTP
jgi:hypothetical protein